MSYKFIYIFIFASFIATLVINYYFSDQLLWMLLLIPSVAIIFLSPTWKTTIVVGILGIILIMVAELFFYQSKILYEDVVSLIMTGILECIIFIVISFFQIKTAKLIIELGNFALTDPLTGIYNRRYLELYMEKMIPLSQEQKQVMTLIMFDIDHFKKINDTYGHHAGDAVLKKIVRVIKGAIRDSDVFVRIGGEEFIILLPNCSLEHGIKFAERIRTTVENTKFIYKGIRIFVTISIGVTEYIEGQDLKKFLEKADQALYKAKATGRNKVVGLNNPIAFQN
ncbi:two-component system, cell cycle response regulator [Parageobacillus thermantarcticus]|uniref:Two-component system, cell cycle response regulator n=1 Tax=Parageobacillus thermantarcticus TaxID=186116 RepID=A0A1I0TN67_9BACL|nr:GGDEF domain-containing protein [Parageobacillus thermantarcticus]SFA53212.1 two-component system, cell cycle response regulator [Parageobacillus thermantarcticus]